MVNLFTPIGAANSRTRYRSDEAEAVIYDLILLDFFVNHVRRKFAQQEDVLFTTFYDSRVTRLSCLYMNFLLRLSPNKD